MASSSQVLPMELCLLLEECTFQIAQFDPIFNIRYIDIMIWMRITGNGDDIKFVNCSKFYKIKILKNKMLHMIKI